MRIRTLALAAACLLPAVPAFSVECLSGHPAAADVVAWPHTLPGGGDRYAFLYRPLDAPCGQEAGRRVTHLGVHLWAPADAAFTLRAQLLAAVDLGGGCLSPGAVLLESPLLPVTAPASAGALTVEIPCGFVCVSGEEPCFLAVALSAHDPDLQLGLAAGTATCASYADLGDGFVDLVAAEWGEPALYARVQDCTDISPAVPLTWDAVKARYR